MPAVKKIIIIDSMRRTEIENSLKQSKRLDGRTLLDYREISIIKRINNISNKRGLL